MTTQSLGEAGGPLTGIRRTIARRMTEAWKIPAFHTTVYLEASRAEATRRNVAGATLTDVLVRAAGVALLEHPLLNARFTDDEVRISRNVHVGIAVALDQGLIVPVLRNVEVKDLRAITADRQRLVEMARAGRLTSADVGGGTFTISNLGMFGVAHFDAILNPPEVAILAVGGLDSRLRLENGVVRETPQLAITLTADHRVVDGALAASFLKTMKREFEK